MAPLRLLPRVALCCAVFAASACDDDPISVADPTPDGAGRGDATPDAAEGGARPPDGATADAATVDAAPADGALDAAPDGARDVAPPVDAGPDAAPCVFTPPQPDCSPAGRGHPGGLPAPHVMVSVGFEGELDPTRVHLAPGCRLPVEDVGFTLVTDDPSFFAAQRCVGGAEPEPSGIDWSTWRLALYPAFESPEHAVAWVVDDGGTLFVGAELPLYCGGPAPTSSLVAVLVPADDRPVAERLAECRTGDGLGCCACDVVCDPQPRRVDCECPP